MISRKNITKIKFFFTGNGYHRANFIRKKKLFKGIGDNISFQPRKLPDDPHLIMFHNNITVGSGVTFICHDTTYKVINYLENNSTEIYYGCIEVLSNVYIGANSIILPNVRIGPNVIIGAGSVITKDVPPGSIVAGVPAKVIGNFEDFVEKRKLKGLKNNQESNFDIWENFYRIRETKF